MSQDKMLVSGRIDSLKPVCFDKSAAQFEFPQNKLLALWLSFSQTERERKFTDTRVAAELVGVSQRTIRFWIESGSIQAIRIAEKYHIDKQSLQLFVLKRALQDQ